MLPKILTQIFGSRNDRLLKTYRRAAQEINDLEPRFEALDDAALRTLEGAFTPIRDSRASAALPRRALGNLMRRLWLETGANAHAPTRVEQVSATG